jgi:transcriptional regulator with XRE-family HTH domain
VSFGKVFSDIRRRRRIPMRLFSDRIGVSPSYIHDIERGATVPSPQKLEAIISVLSEVAREQGADPEADARELFRAREETIYVDRLHIDERLARIFISLRELDDEPLATIETALLRALAFYSRCQPSIQSGMSRAFISALDFIETLDEPDQGNVGMEIAEAIIAVIDRHRVASESALDSALDEPRQKDTLSTST